MIRIDLPTQKLDNRKSDTIPFCLNQLEAKFTNAAGNDFAQSLSNSSDQQYESNFHCSILGKRKRKSERDLSYLRNELKKDFLWSRVKIEQIAQDLGMSDTQVYKWWWDQTRKRQKFLSAKEKAFIEKMQTKMSTRDK